MQKPVPIIKQGKELFDYQKEAIEWMKAKEKNKKYGITGGLLCFTMGLGKTFTSLSFALEQQKYEEFPTLIVASKTVMHEWKNQGVEKFYENLKVLYLHKDFNKNLENIKATTIKSFNLVITTYDVCLNICKQLEAHKYVCEYGTSGILKDKIVAIHDRPKPKFNSNIIGTELLYNVPWARIICDESQRFANPTTYLFKAMMSLYGDHKWCLTGTPIRNTSKDVWAQFRFCGFNEIIIPRLWKQQHYFKYNLKDWVHYKQYKLLGITLPKLVEHNHNVNFDPIQKGLYETILGETQNMLELSIKKVLTYASVLAMFTRLRQVCIAPYLVFSNLHKSTDSEERIAKIKKDSNMNDWIDDMLGPAGMDSPKIQKIIDVILSVPKGEKIILFSMFSTCLDLIETAIKWDIPNGQCVKLTGDISGNRRQENLELFKQETDVNILLCHYKVAGEGLNIIEANHVICIEPWWSPAVHNQAISRCYRTGQTRQVNVHWVINQYSLERYILDMCEDKKKLSELFLENKSYTSKSSGLSMNELRQLLLKAKINKFS